MQRGDKMTTTKGIGISELIAKIKQDLLIPQPSHERPLFNVDEVVLEINFTVNGKIDGGFDLGVVTLGSNVEEERVQKVTVRLTPLKTVKRGEEEI